MSRAAEIEKYERAYQNSDYRLGDKRRAHIAERLGATPRGSLLDVSTGRGEVLGIATALGFEPVRGTEAVGYLCGEGVDYALAHALPYGDNAFDTVCMFDVMEHLLPEDTGAVCGELKRVAHTRVILTVHNGPHVYRGTDLHINRRASYEAWHEELERHFGCHVVRHGIGESISEMFEVAL